MKVMIFYRDASEHGRSVREFLRAFKRQIGRDLEEVNPDTPSGGQLCQLYDIVEYPTLVAVDDQGQLLQQWRGLPLPLISEISYYAR